MEKTMKLTQILLSTLLALNLSALTVGEIPKNIVLDGDNGALVKDSSAWNSNTLKDKVLVMFYVDPDEKDTNNAFSSALKEKAFDRANYGSVAIINMAATWKPNFAIASALESKQEEFPDTLYVKDLKRVLVNEWGLKDDASNILIFSKSGELLFYHSGALDKSNIEKALGIIQNNL